MEKKEKRVYETYQEAYEHLQHIVETTHKAHQHKPTRVYEFKEKWYLTSSPKFVIY